MDRMRPPTPRPRIAEMRALAAELDAQHPKGEPRAMVSALVELAGDEPAPDEWTQRMLANEVARWRRRRERRGDEAVLAEIAANTARVATLEQQRVRRASA